MRTALPISAMAVLLLVTAGVCFAMDSVAVISKERAKELGMEVRSKAAGPDAVWVELEFETQGKLKNVTHVGLEMWAGKKLLLSTILRDNRPSPERRRQFYRRPLQPGQVHLEGVVGAGPGERRLRIPRQGLRRPREGPLTRRLTSLYNGPRPRRCHSVGCSSGGCGR